MTDESEHDDVRWLRASAGILAILLLAYAIQFYRLDARTFHGDELGSIYEAQRLGLNANSIPYFALLRQWVHFGVSEFWLRALSALFAVLAVALTYAWTRQLTNASLARATALILATSPFLIVYSQQIRFYTIGLIGAGLATWTFISFLGGGTPRTLSAWIVASVLAVMTLLMNALLIAAQVITLYWLTPRLRDRSKMLIALGVGAFALALVSIPSVRAWGFNAVAVYTNSQARYDVSRGWGLGQLVKIPFSAYLFGLGEGVYPLTLWFVLPAALALGYAAWRGARMLRHNRLAFWLTIIALICAPVELFLILDPLSPLTQQGAATRYIIFLLPLFCFLLAAGMQTARGISLAVLAVNLISLAFYWYGDWSYADDRINWRQVARWAGDYVSPETRVLVDGQSSALAEYYFPHEWNRTPLVPDVDADAARLIVISYNWHPDARAYSTRALDALATHYELRAVRAEYPFWGYVLDRKTALGAAAAGANGQVEIPIELYGIEYQDLRLPLSARFDERTFNLTGAFGLPRFDGSDVETISLAQPTRARRIILFSHLIDADAAQVRVGAPAANLKIIGEDGLTRVLPLRVGIETGAWDGACACRAAYQWRKRAALLGLQAYPGAWREFDATIFAGVLNLDSSMSIRSLEFERGIASGKFYVWGIVVEP